MRDRLSTCDNIYKLMAPGGEQGLERERGERGERRERERERERRDRQTDRQKERQT